MRVLVAGGTFVPAGTRPSQVQVNTTVMNRNAAELADIAALLIAAGVHSWEVFFVVEVGRGEAELGAWEVTGSTRRG